MLGGNLSDKYLLFIVDIFLFSLVKLGRLFMQIHSAKFHTTVVTNSHCSSLSLSLSHTCTHKHTHTHTHQHDICLSDIPLAVSASLLFSSSPRTPNPPIPPPPPLLTHTLPSIPPPQNSKSSLPPTILKTRPDASGSSYQEIHESVFHSATRGGREDRTEPEPPLSTLPPWSDHEEGKENQALPLV